MPDRSTSWVGGLSLLAAFILAGCAATLRPAVEARTITNNGDGAVARAEGVEMVVETNDWTAFPSSLEREMTPLRATITNNSGHPLKIEYENFALSGVQGVTYRPLPPIDIKGAVTQQSPYPVIAPRFAYRGFWVAPYFHPYLVGPDPWAYGWAYDPLYYKRYYPRWRIDLPTHEMIEMAIPEGVIEPEGQISGFLYFPDLDAASKGDRLTFTANLVDARTDQPFGEVGIPFVFE